MAEILDMAGLISVDVTLGKLLTESELLMMMCICDGSGAAVLDGLDASVD